MFRRAGHRYDRPVRTLRQYADKSSEPAACFQPVLDAAKRNGLSRCKGDLCGKPIEPSLHPAAMPFREVYGVAFAPPDGQGQNEGVALLAESQRNAPCAR